jgi:tRNA (cytidine/uridine-2'-O-)-methyltransferase
MAVLELLFIAAPVRGNTNCSMKEQDPAASATQPPLHVVLHQPQIPQNTGNVGRLCAYTGIRLHLIHPLGFSLDEKHIRRSGLDYWDELDLREHADWNTFLSTQNNPLPRIWMFTTKAATPHWDARFQPGDYLLFGNEGQGCPEWLHRAIPDEQKLKIPQLVPGLRSLNLSTSVGIAAYEAIKSIKEKIVLTVY